MADLVSLRDWRRAAACGLDSCRRSNTGDSVIVRVRLLLEAPRRTRFTGGPSDTDAAAGGDVARGDFVGSATAAVEAGAALAGELLAAGAGTGEASGGSAPTGGLTREMMAAPTSDSTLVALEPVAAPLHGLMLLGRTFKQVPSGSLHFHRSFSTIQLSSTTSCPLCCFAAWRSCSTPCALACICRRKSPAVFQSVAESHCVASELEPKFLEPKKNYVALT